MTAVEGQGALEPRRGGQLHSASTNATQLSVHAQIRSIYILNALAPDDTRLFLRAREHENRLSVRVHVQTGPCSFSTWTDTNFSQLTRVRDPDPLGVDQRLDLSVGARQVVAVLAVGAEHAARRQDRRHAPGEQDRQNHLQFTQKSTPLVVQRTVVDDVVLALVTCSDFAGERLCRSICLLAK